MLGGALSSPWDHLQASPLRQRPLEKKRHLDFPVAVFSFDATAAETCVADSFVLLSLVPASFVASCVGDGATSMISPLVFLTRADPHATTARGFPAADGAAAACEVATAIKLADDTFGAATAVRCSCTCSQPLPFRHSPVLIQNRHATGKGAS